MFWKKKSQYEIITPEQQATEVMEHEMQTSVPVDNIKRYLVEMIEKNERLQARNDELENKEKETSAREQKKREIAQISATDYRKQRDEKVRELMECREKLKNTESERNVLETKYNDAMTKIIDMKEQEKSKEELKEMYLKAAQLIQALRGELNSPAVMEKMTKTRIIEIIKGTLFLEVNNEQK